MRTKTSRRAWTAFAAITLLTGCASPHASPSELASGNRRVTIQIENHNWQDVAVWAVADGTRIRLGTVTTATTQRFSLPATIANRVNDFRLEGHRIGSNDSFLSEPFMVSPGTRLVWKLENQIALSSQFIQSVR